MLYSLLISPIETIVDWVFCFISTKFSSLGIIGAICGVSLVINFLALPIYNVADSIQDKERKIAKALEPRVKQIKKAFKGDEQFMILSTYYRQNNYNPLYVLRSSVSILIQIPFFMAAYNYLSNNKALKGSSFWIFKNLGAPDGLLHIGTFPIHVLPIIMTLINFISGAIYTKGFGLKDKIQVYGIAAVFLILLYNSPSGLVIYWILNNIFSLCKNAVKKMKNPGKILHAVITFILLAASIFLFRDGVINLKKILLVCFAIFIGALPVLSRYFKKLTFIQFEPIAKLDFKTVLLSGLGLALLCGFLLPASTIATSPDEFSYLGNTPSPTTYIWTATFIFLGLFVIWPVLLCKMFGEKVQKWTAFVFLYGFIIALINTFVFKADYGNLNVVFELGNPNKDLECSKTLSFIALLAGLAVAAVLLFIRKTKIASYIPLCLIAVCIAETGLGITKFNYIKNSFSLIRFNEPNSQIEFSINKEYNLSKNKQNVVVLFLDRAINTFTPEIFEKYPEIKEQFDGFTYYPNTLSFSNFTVEGAPAIYGGYEYTPEEMNVRSDEMLRTKHNEALMVMPKLFSNAGFETTVSDPPWPNYEYTGGYEIFDAFPDINVFEIGNKYFNTFRIEKGLVEDTIDAQCQTGCIDFSIVQCLPPFLRITFYNGARRNDVFASARNFFSELSNLYYLSDMTDLSSEKETFTVILNATPHEADINLADDLETPSKIQTDNISLKHYQATAAALKQIGKWLDYLKENNAYNNTRIILVSDHGRNIETPRGDINAAFFGAFLLVKDFNATGDIRTDNTFMTNADTLFIAKEGLPVSDTNPFTGKKLTQDKENGINVYSCLDWNAPTNYPDGYQFAVDLDQSWHVSNDIFDSSNWIPLSEYSVSKEAK